MELLDGEVSVLNAARSVIAGVVARIEKETRDVDGTHGYFLGRVAEASTRAGSSIFEMLNSANSYGDVHLTHEQLHMRPKPDAS